MSVLRSTKIREPVQKRSRAALARIFESANALISARPFDQVSVSEIAEKAGVSVGSIYQRFKTKDDLLWALYEDYLEQAEQQFEQAFAEEPNDADIRECVHTVVRTVATLFQSRRGVVLSLLLRYRQSPEDIPGSFITRINKVYDLAMVHLAQASAYSPSSPKIRFAFSMIVASCREEYLFQDTGKLMKKTKTAADFQRLLCAAVIGVLQSEKSK